MDNLPRFLLIIGLIVLGLGYFVQDNGFKAWGAFMLIGSIVVRFI